MPRQAPTPFDELAKTLTQPRSRRGVLKGLIGALAAALAGATGRRATRADNLCKPSGRRPQSKCNKHAQCCSGGCCDGFCADLSTTGNCGGCGTTCPTPAHGAATCTSGVCGVSCDAGFIACGGRCVDPTADVDNCGACGAACAVNEHCVAAPDGTGRCVCGDRDYSCAELHPDWPQPGTYCCPSSPPAGGRGECLRACGDDFIDFEICQATSQCPPDTTPCIEGGVGPTYTCLDDVHGVCCPSGTTCDTTTGACQRR